MRGIIGHRMKCPVELGLFILPLHLAGDRSHSRNLFERVKLGRAEISGARQAPATAAQPSLDGHQQYKPIRLSLLSTVQQSVVISADYEWCHATEWPLLIRGAFATSSSEAFSHLFYYPIDLGIRILSLRVSTLTPSRADLPPYLTKSDHFQFQTIGRSRPFDFAARRVRAMYSRIPKAPLVPAPVLQSPLADDHSCHLRSRGAQDKSASNRYKASCNPAFGRPDDLFRCWCEK